MIGVPAPRAFASLRMAVMPVFRSVSYPVLALRCDPYTYTRALASLYPFSCSSHRSVYRLAPVEMSL